ncbi:hypothetical protein INT43_008370 [Umbelopsis isabellina]|uniref:Uncharacterized protein n=1 Tax=Mortierella isabellina TaxID=91625 RepID=A0A8H7PD03_MORIS|nr:hypothetical protein INT43_008370 [Umbelopsis isabellina]
MQDHDPADPMYRQCQSLAKAPLFDSLPCLSSWNCEKRPVSECTLLPVRPASTSMVSCRGSSRSSSIKSDSSISRRQVRFSSEPPDVRYYEYMAEEDDAPENVTPTSVEPLMIYYPPPRSSSMCDSKRRPESMLPSPPSSPKGSSPLPSNGVDGKPKLHHTLKTWARRFSSQ